MSRRERVPPRQPGGGPGSGPGELPPSIDSGAGGAAKRQPPWDKPPEPGGASFGDWLRRQREMREISLRDIADRTKISLRYLQAMEDNRFDLLPAPIFAKGFLREYARYVGLSPDEVVNHYLSVQQAASSEEEGVKKDTTLAGQSLASQRPHRVKPVRSWTYGLFLALSVLVLIGLVAALYWYAERRRDNPAEDAAPPPIAAPPAPTSAAAPMPTPDRPRAPLEVTLDFTADCWVEVVTDGKPLVAEQRVQGESLPIEAQESVQIKLGDAGAAEIQVNGIPYPLNGKQGEVREVLIDLETVRQLQGKKEAP
ncbi:MAG TPA: RodZ domain-containing protein [Thermoanaerobaculia bacterium]|nr:RodZ domain-containing protein [Thermoanaerobaculia bacterium]